MPIAYDEELKGRAVIDATGRVPGSVDGLLVDSTTWQIQAFRVKLRREAAELIGADHRTFHASVIEVPVALVHAAGDTMILNVAAEALRQTEPPEASV